MYNQMEQLVEVLRNLNDQEKAATAQTARDILTLQYEFLKREPKTYNTTPELLEKIRTNIMGYFTYAQNTMKQRQQEAQAANAVQNSAVKADQTPTLMASTLQHGTQMQQFPVRPNAQQAPVGSPPEMEHGTDIKTSPTPILVPSPVPAPGMTAGAGRGRGRLTKQKSLPNAGKAAPAAAKPLQPPQLSVAQPLTTELTPTQQTDAPTQQQQQQTLTPAQARLQTVLVFRDAIIKNPNRAEEIKREYARRTGEDLETVLREYSNMQNAATAAAAAAPPSVSAPSPPNASANVVNAGGMHVRPNLHINLADVPNPLQKLPVVKLDDGGAIAPSAQAAQVLTVPAPPPMDMVMVKQALQKEFQAVYASFLDPKRMVPQPMESDLEFIGLGPWEPDQKVPIDEIFTDMKFSTIGWC
ncbi:hypothetical protein BC829DRAFT_254027 [Chytridium lagenaria]|nr:hypothetical protein BC829DRAFT_254027 [Chytridium lagenaria]